MFKVAFSATVVKLISLHFLINAHKIMLRSLPSHHFFLAQFLAVFVVAAAALLPCLME